MKPVRISISELAKISGVSPGTVDRALNNRKDINSETKEKILKIAKEYGYRPQINDESDAIKGQVGIIVFNLENEYFAKLVTELEKILQSINYGAAIMLSHGDKSKEIECIRSLYNMGVDGIVMCPVNGGREFANYIGLFDIPIVTTGNNIGLPYVGVDDFTAMKEFVAEVLDGDFERIIYFSPALENPEAYAQQLRYEGFLAAADGRAFEVVTNQEEIPEICDEKTLIVCSSDYYASKVYFKVEKAVITGFDNIDALNRYRLNISSVGYSMKEIAEGVMEIIMGKQKNNKYVAHYIAKR